MLLLFLNLNRRKQGMYYESTFDLKVRLKGSTDWILASGRDSIRIGWLKECSLYEFRYQLTCDSLFSDFSAIDTFTTSCKSGAIDQLATIIIRPNPANDHLTIDRLAYIAISISGWVY